MDGGGRNRDGSRDNPLAHALMADAAERSVRTHGRRRDVVLFFDAEPESGMYVAEPQNIHRTTPPHQSAGRAGLSRRAKAGTER